MTSPLEPSAPTATAVASPATEAPEPRLTPWQARTLRRATRADLFHGAAVLALGALALWSGNAAGRYLSPAGASSASTLLDELELPRALPNADLAREDGTGASFWELIRTPPTIVTFYAPWCGPCQEELPVLVRGTTNQPDRLAVVVGADEDLADVRKQLDNLGLPDLRFYVDTHRQLAEGGRVTALPTTFLVGRLGRVQDRLIGSSRFRLQMLLFRVSRGQDEPAFIGGS